MLTEQKQRYRVFFYPQATRIDRAKLFDRVESLLHGGKQNQVYWYTTPF